MSHLQDAMSHIQDGHWEYVRSAKALKKLVFALGRAHVLSHKFIKQTCGTELPVSAWNWLGELSGAFSLLE